MRISYAALLVVALGALAVRAQDEPSSSAVNVADAPAATPSGADETASPSEDAPAPAATDASQSETTAAPATTALNMTASSDYTLPRPDATATMPPDFVVQQSNPFVFTEVDRSDIPELNYSLMNESSTERLQLCQRQVKYCATAGCKDPEATIKNNFCNPNTMGAACTCTKGAHNLMQWQWPVQFSDCLRRGSTCKQQCLLPSGTTADRYNCRQACDRAFGDTCGMPNQFAANYAVTNQDQKPKLSMIQGGNANSAARLAAGSLAAVGVVTAGMLLL